MSQYNYDVPIKIYIENCNAGGLASLYRLVDEKRFDAQEILLINSLTTVFAGRSLGKRWQLRITPTNRKSSQSSERKATCAEMLVFDSNGVIDDYFVKGFHQGYDTKHIKTSMRNEIHLRNDFGWKVKP